MSKLDVHTAHLSRTGGRKRNEDSCGYWTSDAGCCWVVSDGAGGHGGGDVASRLVVKTVLERFAANPVVSSEMAVNLLETAHAELMKAKEQQPAGPDMHATCVLLMIDREQGQAVWGHAGDSRAYLFRNGQLTYQTRDHSLVQSMIDAGYGSTDLIRTHPQRSLLTSAIGNAGELVISVSGDPVPTDAGDVFMLCSDGWWEYVDEAHMQRILTEASSADAWLESMADIVERDAGTDNDNYTAVGIVVNSAESATTIILGPRGAHAEPPEESVS